MNKRQLILLPILGSIVLLLAGAGASFAWYQSHTDLRLETVKVEGDAERNLRVSLTGEKDSFVESLSMGEELEEVGFFTPVSPMFQSSWEEGVDSPQFYDVSYPQYDQFNGEPYKKLAKDGYFSIDLYLVCDDDVIVSLDEASTLVSPDESKNESYAELLSLRDDAIYSKEEYKSRLDEGVKSLRLGFLIDGEYSAIDPFASPRTLLGGALDNDNDRYYDFYQDRTLGGLYEVFYGEVEDRALLVYDEPLEEDSVVEAEYSAFHARHKAGVHRLNIEKSLQNGAKIAEEGAISLASLDAEMPPFAFILDAYTPKKVNVSLYLEGWDEDSLNGGMGSSFLANIVFKIVRTL